MNDLPREIDIEKTLSEGDPRLGKLIALVTLKAGKFRPASSKSSPFQALLRAIVYQQLAGGAAAAIYKRLQKAVRGPLTPKKALLLSPVQLRSVGLSNSKARYIHNLANWFNSNKNIVSDLPSMSNDQIIAAVTSITGVGIWTANIFLIFNLQRLDVIPTNDLGIRRGVQILYGLKEMPPPALVERKARRWQPYRSIASMYLWNALRLKITTTDLKAQRKLRVIKNRGDRI